MFHRELLALVFLFSLDTALHFTSALPGNATKSRFRFRQKLIQFFIIQERDGAVKAHMHTTNTVQ